MERPAKPRVYPSFKGHPVASGLALFYSVCSPAPARSQLVQRIGHTAPQSIANGLSPPESQNKPIGPQADRDHGLMLERPPTETLGAFRFFRNGYSAIDDAEPGARGSLQ